MNERYKISNDVSFRQVGEEVFVLNRNDSSVFNLNTTAAFIWNRIQNGKTTEVIIRELCECFDIDSDVASIDTRELVEKLLENKMLLPV